MRLEQLPTLNEHIPHRRITRRHVYLVCGGCGWDCRVSAGVELPWSRWEQHLADNRGGD